jgi:hypothetical protein
VRGDGAVEEIVHFCSLLLAEAPGFHLPEDP